MQLKANSLLKILVPSLLLGAGFIGLKACRTSGNETQTVDRNVVADLTGDEMKALGIDGDTPRDTVATLVGQMKQYRAEMEEMRINSAALVKENQRLRERDTSVEGRINSALNRERETFNKELKQQQTSMLDRFQQKLNQLSQKSATLVGDIPPGLGLDNGMFLPERYAGWSLQMPGRWTNTGNLLPLACSFRRLLAMPETMPSASRRKNFWRWQKASVLLTKQHPFILCRKTARLRVLWR